MKETWHEWKPGTVWDRLLFFIREDMSEFKDCTLSESKNVFEDCCVKSQDIFGKLGDFEKSSQLLENGNNFGHL